MTLPADRVVRARCGMLPFGEAHAGECVAFAEAIASGKPSPVPAEQSLDVITILDALYRSAEAGREIRLDQQS